MQEKTALNRFGDVILWFGTSIFAVCVVVSIADKAKYLSGNGGGDVAVGSLVTGVLSWLVLASNAYIFNGRSPVAVVLGLFTRRQRRGSADA